MQCCKALVVGVDPLAGEVDSKDSVKLGASSGSGHAADVHGPEECPPQAIEACNGPMLSLVRRNLTMAPPLQLVLELRYFKRSCV